MEEYMKLKDIFIVFGFAAAFAGADVRAAGGPSALDQERASRKTEIEFYTTGFDGGEVKFDCVCPVIPPTSKTNAEIVKVDHKVQDWFACYNAFAQRLNDALPAGKTIPESVARIMRPDEMARARERMNQVYGAIGDQAQDSATALVAEHEAWRASTVLFATTKNEETKQKLAARMLEFEIALRAQREFLNGNTSGKMGPPPSSSK
jgi:Zn-finger protein